MLRINERRHEELCYDKQHLKLEDLKRMKIRNYYLYKSIPCYPDGVEFQVSYLRHNTNLQGFLGIWHSEGFKKPRCQQDQQNSPQDDLVWWSPDISKSDISQAERRYLDYRRYQPADKPFLHKFTTSPAFLSSSRLGNFRFSMSIHDLLKSYKERFCAGKAPNIRIFKTVVYKQEVMYSIVIHAPCAHDLFSEYPLLGNTEDEDAVCEFHGNTIIWRVQAMSKTHSFWLSRNMKAIRINKKQRQYYMWDNLGVAFHVPHGQIFPFRKTILAKSLRLCEGAQPNLSTEEFVKCEFDLIRL